MSDDRDERIVGGKTIALHFFQGPGSPKWCVVVWEGTTLLRIDILDDEEKAREFYENDAVLLLPSDV